MSLVRRKSYDAITVADICKAANIRRSTFYGHFASKDGLNRGGLEYLRRFLLEHQENAPAASGHPVERCFMFSRPMFEHAREHIESYRALAGTRGGEVALGAIREILSDLLRSEHAAQAGVKAADAMPPELFVRIAVDAYMTLLTWWLDGGAKQPPQQVDAMFRRLVTEGLTPKHL
jgi:AcrR family transcriptional regulator